MALLRLTAGLLALIVGVATGSTSAESLRVDAARASSGAGASVASAAVVTSSLPLGGSTLSSKQVSHRHRAQRKSHEFRTL